MAVENFIPNPWSEKLLESLRASRFTSYARERREVRRTPPTEEEKAQHARALELWDELKDNPFFALDRDEGVVILEPLDHIEWQYTETEAEWRKRVGIDGDTVTIRTVTDQTESDS